MNTQDCKCHLPPIFPDTKIIENKTVGNKAIESLRGSLIRHPAYRVINTSATGARVVKS